MKVLICDYPEPMNRDLDIERGHLRDGLGQDVDIGIYVHQGDRQALLAALQGVDAVLTAYLEFPREVLQACDRLRFISIEATGYNFVDAGAAQELGIGVAVIGEYCTQEVADHTLALALCATRSLKAYDVDICQRHRYDFNCCPPPIRLQGAVFGIVGLGKIGRAVARRAQGFGMEVLAYDPYCPADLASENDVRSTTLEELYARSDILSLHTLLTPQTRGMLNRDAFAKMRRQPVIVNVSRGDLIVEEDLVHALDHGLVRAAALDVLCQESHEAMIGHPLAGRDNVVLTPHVAFYSAQSMADCARISSWNISHFLRGEPEKVFRMVNQVAAPPGKPA